MCAKLYIHLPYGKRQLQKTKHSCTVISPSRKSHLTIEIVLAQSK